MPERWKTDVLKDTQASCFRGRSNMYSDFSTGAFEEQYYDLDKRVVMTCFAPFHLSNLTPMFEV